METKKNPGFTPMRMHKNCLLHLLGLHDGQNTLEMVFPTWPGTLAQAVEAIKASPTEYVDELELEVPE